MGRCHGQTTRVLRWRAGICLTQAGGVVRYDPRQHRSRNTSSPSAPSVKPSVS
jgi:hypothetical protein